MPTIDVIGVGIFIDSELEMVCVLVWGDAVKCISLYVAEYMFVYYVHVMGWVTYLEYSAT